MILKIQKSFFTTESPAPIYLIYNKSRSLSYQTKEPRFEHLFDDYEYKIYADYVAGHYTKLTEEPDW